MTLWVCGWRQGRGVYQSICCVNKKEAGTCAYHISFVRRTVTLFFRASVMAGYSLVQSTRGDSYTLDSYTLEKVTIVAGFLHDSPNTIHLFHTNSSSSLSNLITTCVSSSTVASSNAKSKSNVLYKANKMGPNVL
jgi:hypothetical protein